MSTINLRQSTLTSVVDNRNSRLSGKKSKLQDSKSNLVKPSKRAALGTITNVTATRVQPFRAAKATLQDQSELQSCSYRNENSAPESNPFSTIATQNSRHTFSIHLDEPSFDCAASSHAESANLLDCITGLSRPPLAEVNTKTCLSTDSPMIISSPNDDDCVIINSDEVEGNLEIANIDHVSEKVLGISEYTQDIYKYLKEAEQKYRPKPGYMKKQTDINYSMRSILVDWLVEVAEEYKLMEQTLYLTVNYIDRFLSCMSVMRGKLQLVGTACMLIASKFEEIYPPEVSEFVYITDDTYTAKQVLRMEHLILKTLKFDLSVPTALNFLTRYLAAARAPAGGSKLESLAKYLCELTMQHYDPFLKYLPSTIAASSVCVACSTLGMPVWTPTLSYYTGYKLEELQSCILDIHKTFVGASTYPQQAVNDKYKLVRHHQVSLISPPLHPPV